MQVSTSQRALIESHGSSCSSIILRWIAEEMVRTRRGRSIWIIQSNTTIDRLIKRVWVRRAMTYGFQHFLQGEPLERACSNSSGAPQIESTVQPRSAGLRYWLWW
jgi:hypothetical protein